MKNGCGIMRLKTRRGYQGRAAPAWDNVRGVQVLRTAPLDSEGKGRRSVAACGRGLWGVGNDRSKPSKSIKKPSVLACKESLPDWGIVQCVCMTRLIS